MKKSLIVIILCFMASPYLRSQNMIEKYEYWFDQDFAAHEEVNVAPSPVFNLNTQISAANLSDGLHTLHFRFKDTDGNYSSVVSRFIIKSGVSTLSTNNITEWQYWYDQDFAGALTASISPVEVFNLNTAIVASSISDGLHTIHFRFKDEAGQWSSVVSRFIIKNASSSGSVTNNINAWEYWFDQNYAGSVVSPASASQVFDLSSAIDASALDDGLHTIHLRFKDDFGQWSSVVSRFVIKTGQSSIVSNEIVGYQYWFDQDFTNQVFNSVNPSQVFSLNEDLDVSGLDNGLHTMHVRFQDTRGQWSSVVSRFIIKNNVSNVVNNLITTYRYWFDEADSAMHYHNLAAPVEVYNLNAAISLAHLPKGDHTIHFQFKDTLQQWSSVVTDTILKHPLPVALFEGDTLIFCDNGTVQFTDQSIDAETWYWSFGDGTTSTDQNPVHSFTSPGVYDVSLQVSDIGSGLDSTLNITAYVGVFETPDATINLSGNPDICDGTDITLSVNSGYLVEWSTNETSDAISVNLAGMYEVTLTHPMFSACTSSNSVEITVKPLAIADFSFVVTGFNSSFTDASTAANTWSWTFGDGNNSSQINPTHSYSGDGIYEVCLTVSNDCNTDTYCQDVTVSTISVPEHGIQVPVAALYPNPAVEFTQLLLAGSGSEEMRWLMYNMEGRLIHSGQVYMNSVQTIDVSTLANGRYMVVVEHEDYRLSLPMVVAR